MSAKALSNFFIPRCSARFFLNLDIFTRTTRGFLLPHWDQLPLCMSRAKGPGSGGINPCGRDIPLTTQDLGLPAGDRRGDGGRLVRRYPGNRLTRWSGADPPPTREWRKESAGAPTAPAPQARRGLADLPRP